MVDEALADWMTLADAAARLSCTPQRVGALVRAGTLRSTRLGRTLLVLRDDVESRSEVGPVSGRRFNARTAWALILLADQQEPLGLDATITSRLTRLLRRATLYDLRARLSSRATRSDFRAHSSDLTRLALESGVVRSGARFAAEAGIDLIAPDAPVELYVNDATMRRLVRRYRLMPTTRPNVVLRVVPDEITAWMTGSVAPRSAIALDLVEDRDGRSQETGRRLLTSR